MVVVKTTRDFFIKNDRELKNYAVYKTGISDEELIKDIVQDFYVKMIKTKVLETFNPEKVTYGSVRDMFERYICNLFCWQLSYLKKKNYRIRLKAYSMYEKDNKVGRTCHDIYDYVGQEDAEIKVDPVYDASIVTDEKEQRLEWYVERFKEYIKKTEPEEEAYRLVTLLESRYNGCNSRDVAVMLGVSDNMAKIHKKKLYKKYHEWRKNQLDP